MNAQFIGPAVTHAAILDAMTTHNWVHMACHARQARADPTLSGFAFWDGPLTIAELSARPIQQRELAFLSACQTATGSVQQIDEAIHLAAAMQFLGYRHVIATMWSIADRAAPQVAYAVYSALVTDGAANSDRTAEALHYAVNALRQEDPTNPLLWAPYAHLGG